MMLVEALIMGAGYKAVRFHRQAKTPCLNTKAAPGGGLCLDIGERRSDHTGLHGAGTSR